MSSPKGRSASIGPMSRPASRARCGTRGGVPAGQRHGLITGQELARGHRLGVPQRLAQRLGGLPGEGLHVLLAARGLDEAGRRRDRQPPHGMDLAGRPLVHGNQPGVRPRVRGQLSGQAGDPRVKQPVDARGRYLARMRERRGQLITVGRQVEPMESRGADEPAPQGRPASRSPR